MMARETSENRIEAERVKRSIAVISGDFACISVPGLLDDQAMRNLALLYGGASRRPAPVFAPAIGIIQG
jgi:hypothetical protein